MRLKVVNVKLDKLDEIALQLTRIADLLDGILHASDPLPPDLEVEDDPSKTVFYTNERELIVQEKLARIRGGRGK